jgi:hypothetical protein
MSTMSRDTTAGTFPSLNLRWRVPDGISELVGAYARHGLDYDDFTSARFVRVRRIRELVSASLLDAMLRRLTSDPFPPQAYTSRRTLTPKTPGRAARLGAPGGVPIGSALRASSQPLFGCGGSAGG